MDFHMDEEQMANNAPVIPPHNEDIPLVEEIEPFEDPVEDPVHVELDRILIRMAAEEANAPEIPPYDQDIPLMEEIYNFALSIEAPDDDELMHANAMEFAPNYVFQNNDLYEDMRQAVAVVEGDYEGFAVARLHNEPELFQGEDVMQYIYDPNRHAPEVQIEAPQQMEGPIAEIILVRPVVKRNGRGKANANKKNNKNKPKKSIAKTVKNRRSKRLA